MFKAIGSPFADWLCLKSQDLRLESTRRYRVTVLTSSNSDV
jgi:hypothetical protein